MFVKVYKFHGFIYSNFSVLLVYTSPDGVPIGISFNQRTNGPVNAHLIYGPTVSTKTSKIGQGQPRVIIYINFVELEPPMLHAKFQDHRNNINSCSGEEDF